MNDLFAELNSTQKQLIPSHQSNIGIATDTQAKSEANLPDFLENIPIYAFDKIIGKLESLEVLRKMACLSSSIQQKITQSAPVVYWQSLPDLFIPVSQAYQDGQIKAFFEQAENSCFSPTQTLHFLEKLPWPQDLALGLKDVMFLSDHLNAALRGQICIDETVKATLTYQQLSFY